MTRNRKNRFSIYRKKLHLDWAEEGINEAISEVNILLGDIPKESNQDDSEYKRVRLILKKSIELKSLIEVTKGLYWEKRRGGHQ